jgi:hypothetical protein
MVVGGKTWQRIAVTTRWEYLPPDSFWGGRRIPRRVTHGY